MVNPRSVPGGLSYYILREGYTLYRGTFIPDKQGRMVKARALKDTGVTFLLYLEKQGHVIQNILP